MIGKYYLIVIAPNSPLSEAQRMVERLVIDRLGHRGDGIATGEGGAIHVPGALPGETVEVEVWPGHSDRRRLLHVEKPSGERIAPICPHFGVCGGCAVQHWNGARYRTWKCNLVIAALQQAGLEARVGDLIDAHGEGRRRAVFHARSGTDGVLAVGFSAARAHRLIAIDRCPILAKSLDGAIDAAWEIAEAVGRVRKALDIQVTTTEAGLDVDVRGSGLLPAPLMSALARVAEKRDLARLTRHGELVAQLRTPTLRIGKAIVHLPPAAFLQATAEGEAVLAELVLSACAGAVTIADLFAGIGPFALRLAQRSHVLAVDSDQAALAAVKRAAAETPGLKPIEVELRDLFKRPYTAPELDRFDAVVLDPPRQGAIAQARALSASRVPVIVAVSCNPATFARDVAELVRGGYRLAEVLAVDQFRYTAHVEIVARLER